MTRSCEHVMSIELQKDFSTFVESMRNLDTALGQARRLITDEQKKKRLPGQEKCFCKKRFKVAGHVLIRQDFDLWRPGGGLISPLNYDFFLGRKLSSGQKSWLNRLSKETSYREIF